MMKINLRNTSWGKSALIATFVAAIFFSSVSPVMAIDPGKTTVPTFVGECTADGALGILCGFSVATQSLILGLLTAVKSLFGIILSAATTLTIWAIEDFGINITTHQAVSDGFAMALSVANIVFVIAIIMIAFSTILRWHEYEAKKLLPKLIITALLVNFSLLAAGLMLDTSNMLTKFFLKKEVVNTTSIGSALDPQAFGAPAIYGAVADLETFRARYRGAVDSRNVFSFLESYSKESIRNNLGFSDNNGWTRERFESEILNNDAKLTEVLASNGHRLKTSWYEGIIGFESPLGAQVDIGTLWSQFIDLLPRVIFAILATFVAMMTMVAMFLMAVIRNIWVIVLLISMPVAWSLRVLPKFEHFWRQWWEKFLNWGVLYLPTVSFFLYLAVITAGNTSIKLQEGMSGSLGIIPVTTQNADFLGAGVNGAPSLVTSLVLMLITIGLMIAGLKIAGSMGSHIATAFAGAAGRGTRKLAGGMLKASVGIPAAIAGGLGGLLYGSAQAVRHMGELDSATKTKKGFGKSTKDFIGNIFSGVRSGSSAVTNAPTTVPRSVAGGFATVLASLGAIPGVGNLVGPAAQALSEFANSTKALEDIQKQRWGNLKGNALKAALSGVFNNPLASLKETAAALDMAHKNHMLDIIDSPEKAIRAANAMAAMSPSIKRKKIGAIKDLAAHYIDNAAQISGETPQEILASRNELHIEGEHLEHLLHESWNLLKQSQVNSLMGVSAENEMRVRQFYVEKLEGRLDVEGQNKWGQVIASLQEIARLTKERKNSPQNLQLLNSLNEQQRIVRKTVTELDDYLDRFSKTDRAGWSNDERNAYAKLQGMRRFTGAKDEAKHGSHGGDHKSPEGVLGGIRQDMRWGENKPSKPSGGGGAAHPH